MDQRLADHMERVEQTRLLLLEFRLADFLHGELQGLFRHDPLDQRALFVELKNRIQGRTVCYSPVHRVTQTPGVRVRPKAIHPGKIPHDGVRRENAVIED